MKFNVSEINSISELLDHLKEHIGEYKGPIWFRGHADESWKLEPKLMRIQDRLPETHYFNRFKQDASYMINYQPRTEFEWLYLMQHYGISTRLLDWSENPLVALYFSCLAKEEKDGALWVLQPTTLNLKSRYKSEYEFEIPSFEDEHLQNYKPTTIGGEKKTSLLPMAAIAPRNNARMQAQRGVFTISHRDNISVESAGEPNDHVWKYKIPVARKETIFTELKLLGINRFSLFPELESLSHNF